MSIQFSNGVSECLLFAVMGVNWRGKTEPGIYRNKAISQECWNLSNRMALKVSLNLN